MNPNQQGAPEAPLIHNQEQITAEQKVEPDIVISETPTTPTQPLENQLPAKPEPVVFEAAKPVEPILETPEINTTDPQNIAAVLNTEPATAADLGNFSEQLYDNSSNS